jgi:spermidine synthase
MRRLPAQSMYDHGVMTAVFLILAFGSGAASLIYQVVWMRRLALVFGSTTLATSTVLAAFLGGLAVGTVLWARFADRRSRSTLIIFGVVEVATGLYGLASLGIFRGVEAIYLAAYPSIAGYAGLYATLQFLLCAMAIVPPALLMGASLPLLIHRLNADAEFVHRVGAVYGWNTLGAAAGAALATFRLIPGVGLFGAVAVAAVINLLVGFAAFFTSSRWSEAEPSVEPERAEIRRDQTTTFVLLAGIALSGFAAITFEIVWARLLAMIMGSSVYAFGTLVVVILLGLGTGSAIYGGVKRTAEGHQKLFALLEGLIALTGAASLLLLPRMPGWFLRFFPLFRENFDLQVTAYFIIAAAVALVPSLFFGATFPAVVGALGGDVGWRPGKTIGITYAVNTIGTVAGAWLTGFILISRIGVHATAIVGVLAAAAASLLVWARCAERMLPRLPALGPSVAAMLLILAVPNWPQQVFAAGIGFFAPRYGSGETLEEVVNRMRLLYYRDGVSATISVDETGSDLFYRSNGKTDASTQPGDTANQMLLGHLPMLLHPEPREVFVLGLGTGMTAAAVARYPVQGIDIVELEPAGIEAARYFDSYTNRVLDDPRVEMIIGDGRNRLLAVPKQYDVVISDPSDLWVAGISSLATVEYYQTVRARLRQGGVFAQWIHTHTLLPEDFALVTATFHAVFPHIQIWMSSQGDLIFVGAADPVAWDFNRLKKHFDQTAGVAEDMKAIGIWHPFALFGAYVLGETETAALAAEASGLHTDDHPVLEFRTPRSLYVETTPMIAQELNRFRKADPPVVPGFDLERDLDAEGNYLLGFAYASVGRPDLGVKYMEKSTTMAPNEPQFFVGLAHQYQQTGRIPEAQAAYEKALNLDLNNVEALLSLGEIRLELGQIEWTRLLAERALRLAPQNARAHALVDRLQEAER